MNDYVIECSGLYKNYGTETALSGLDLKIKGGGIVGLLGPNGSGKTTLIKTCAGLLTPTAGTVRVCGMAPSPETKALVSYLPEFTYFENHMRIRQCFEMFGDFYDDFDILKAENMLRDLGVNSDRRMKELSKGMKEKVQLVTVMSRKARLYLLDEPIAGVDPASRDYILDMIIRSYDPEATVLISTHLISDIEKVLDEYVFLSQGHLFRQGGADELRADEGKSIDELFREVFRYENR